MGRSWKNNKVTTRTKRGKIYQCGKISSIYRKGLKTLPEIDVASPSTSIFFFMLLATTSTSLIFVILLSFQNQSVKHLLGLGCNFFTLIAISDKRHRDRVREPNGSCFKLNSPVTEVAVPVLKPVDSFFDDNSCSNNRLAVLIHNFTNN